MTDANHDPYAERFRPDPELLAIAHNQMLKEEMAPHRFVRQRWEEALGALRVALPTVREVFPSEGSAMPPGMLECLRSAERHLEEAFIELDSLAEEMLGEAMTRVLDGTLTTVDDYQRFVGGR